MQNTIKLHVAVIRFVIAIDHIMSGLCMNPCNIKQKAPTAIIRKAGRDIPSVLRVRMV